MINGKNIITDKNLDLFIAGIVVLFNFKYKNPVYQFSSSISIYSFATVGNVKIFPESISDFLLFLNRRTDFPGQGF